MKRYVLWLLVGVGGTLTTGCYQNVKGCLDPRAKNLDVRADVSCCCVYPSLLWSVEADCNGTAIGWDDTCAVATERWKVLAYEMVLSEVTVYIDDKAIHTDSTIALRLHEDELIRVRDDIRVLRGGGSSAVIPKFITEGSLQQVEFTIGIPHSGIRPSSFPEGHPMREDTELWDTLKGYRIVYLQALELNSGDTTRIELFQHDVDTVRWRSSTSVVGVRGKDLRLSLIAEFAEFLSAHRQHQWTKKESLRQWKSRLRLKQ